MANKYTKQPPEVRFWAFVARNGAEDCWNWTGGLYKTGYASFWGYRRTTGHRFSYELANGQIPDGLQIDHLCRNRQCVNPAHLEAVSQAVNIRRGFEARKADGTLINGQSLKTHCPRGHAYIPENTRLKTSHHGRYKSRLCITCRRFADKKRRARRQRTTPNGAKTHCPQGHPYDQENTYHAPNNSRACRACRAVWNAEKRAKRAQKRTGEPPAGARLVQTTRLAIR